MLVNTSKFASKDNNEIISCRYSFLTFLHNFDFVLGLLNFHKKVFDIMYEDLLYGYYSLQFKFCRKVLPVTLIFLLLYILIGLFLSGANKGKKSVARKCFQLKALKVSLMCIFVTLLINKATGRNNRHFLFNTLKSENKEEFLTASTFCTFEIIEKNILQKQLSQDVLSKVHLNKYESHFKSILLLSSDLNLNPGSTTPKRNDIKWELLPFCKCSFSTEWMDYHLDPLSVVSNDAWNIFQKRDMHFIHLNVNSLIPKIDEIRYTAKLTNSSVIGLMKLNFKTHF